MSNHITKQGVLFKGLSKKALVARFDQEQAALPLCGEGVQALVLGDADNVTHVVALAPQQHPPAAKTGVATEDNSDLWPDLSQSFNQQSQDRPGMRRRRWGAGN